MASNHIAAISGGVVVVTTPSLSNTPTSSNATPNTIHSGQPQTQQQLVKNYTNSLLHHLYALGFEKNNTTFNELMFIRPNSKGFELIVQFLLTQLDPDRASRVFVPLCKEGMREFKDNICNWLNELATGTSSGTSGKSSNSGQSGQGKSSSTQQQNSPSTNPAHTRLFQYIRFPTVSKSLLTVPCGIKACEILYALLTHVVLTKTLRISM